jgi:hypothetical protein
MAFYVQHGHGKSDKISKALEQGVIDGVILSPRNESLANMSACIAECRQHDCEILFDPQFYVSTLVPAKDGYLPQDYKEYYTAGRTSGDFIRAKKNREYARGTLDVQVALGVDGLISPSVIFDSFSDKWSQTALTLADASLEYHSELKAPPPLLLTIIFDEAALSSKDELDKFLDIITAWDVEGFYLVLVRSDSGYSQRFDEARLSHLLYFVHVLGVVNEYRVICGYSDFVGVLLRAAGASGFATGWYQSLRQFHRKAFLMRKAGGQPSRERYSSLPLVNSIFLSELQSIYEVGALEQVLSGVDLDAVVKGSAGPEASTWNRPTSEVHHWQTLAALEDSVAGGSASDLDVLLEQLKEASGLYAQLEGQGVQFERQTDGRHLGEWIRGITQFRELV